MLQDFRKVPNGYKTTEPGTAPPVFLAHLYALAREGSRMVAFAALLCIRVLVSSLRYERTQRVARHAQAFAVDARPRRGLLLVAAAHGRRASPELRAAHRQRARIRAGAEAARHELTRDQEGGARVRCLDGG